MGLFAILFALGLLMWLAYRGWSILLVSPLAALVAAALSGEPLLAHWTQTFMNGAARFFIQWFPMFLLGGLFGKLMDDSKSISSIANFLTEPIGNSQHDARSRACLSPRYLRWRQRLRCLFRVGPDGANDVSVRRSSAAAIACNDRSWCIYVHDVCPSRLTVGQ